VDDGDLDVEIGIGEKKGLVGWLVGWLASGLSGTLVSKRYLIR
jgi:hypothetical protein